MNLHVNLTPTHIADLLNPDKGVTTIQIEGMNSGLLEKLCQQAEISAFEPASKELNGVAQNFCSCGKFDEGSLWKELAKQLSEQLNLSISPYITEPIQFTDLSLQKYNETLSKNEFGISPHRDHGGFINLVVVLLLSGPSAFFICKDKSGTDAIEIPANPGELIIMRGGKFANDLPRPIHFVGKIPTGGRISFGLRQVVHDSPETLKLRKIFGGNI